jgi:hypothetical protein
VYDQFEQRVNFASVGFPAGMSDIYKFEADNPEISVNIFIHSEGEFYPVHSTNLDGNISQNRIGVNLVQNTSIDLTSGELVDHFYPVTNLSKFTQKKYMSNLTGATSYAHNISCDICTRSFRAKAVMDSENSFILNNGELHLGFTSLNTTQAYIDHIFICKQGVYKL